MLELDPNGKLYTPNQVTDYRCRGKAFETMNVFSFFADTWEDAAGKDKNENEKTADDNGDILPNDDEDNDTKRTRGRPRNARVPYMPDHPNKGKKSRVKRSTMGHNNIPNFVRRYFAKRHDDEEMNDLFYASMLL